MVTLITQLIIKDYVTRTITKTEEAVRCAYEGLTQLHNLIDSYRFVPPKGGYTWGHRNNLRVSNPVKRMHTRLDRIYITDTLIRANN